MNSNSASSTATIACDSSTFVLQFHHTTLSDYPVPIALSLLAFRVQHSHVAADRDAHIASAQKSLASVVEPARLRRADLRSREERVREIWDSLDIVRKANEKSECSLCILGFVIAS